MSAPAKLTPPASHHQTNWPLLIGGLLALGIGLVAWLGPDLAPQDPLKENLVMLVGEKFVSAPFAPMAVPGFPLGSDERGRDLLSLLLWAVRPTLLLVTLVAAVRLSLGLAFGLAAGWHENWFGRGLEAAMGVALAAPVLIVALGVIAVLGLEQGTLVFGIGLALTGWAEAARVVHEETRRLKQQNYVEAARALGASAGQILLRHILPHILPFVWSLAAFEISHTLLTVASLGFLGYYTNDVWQMISDTAAQRYSGKPDLGQMLATVTSDIFTGPWKMFAAGSAIFLIVFAFNLLGEGLRQHFMFEQGPRRTPFTAAQERFSDWASTKVGGRVVWVGRVLALLLLLGGGGYWVTTRIMAAWAASQPPPVLTVPGDHLWATERHDPYGTRWTNVLGPHTAPQIAWTFNAPGLSGGPAVAADGTVYVGGAQAVYALDPQGQTLWQTPVPTRTVGTPALDAAGNVYAVLITGQLMAFSAQGQVLWTFTPEPTPGLIATSGPMVGPDGTVYYTIVSDIQAVAPSGAAVWRTNAEQRRISLPPRLTPMGDLAFITRILVDVPTGERFVAGKGVVSSPAQYVMGADSGLYLRQDNFLSSWDFLADGAQIIHTYRWSIGGNAFGLPTDAGVAHDGTLWLSYTPDFQDARFVWIYPETSDTLGDVRFAHRPSRLLGLDQENVAYFCGLQNGTTAECVAYRPTVKDPLWRLNLGQGPSLPLGGAIVPGRIYVVTDNGTLLALAGN